MSSPLEISQDLLQRCVDGVMTAMEYLKNMTAEQALRELDGSIVVAAVSAATYVPEKQIIQAVIEHLGQRETTTAEV